ncbi:3-beta-glucanosyltransferase [Seminavis robusta]|uniref:3-beta-glucanosyltransferase n=1 Tax=Seminavis robusta TaxID=568900 RepID=A0A9N8EJV7_9STRA|nr:3-beta-glucanosyltransferase [Seminavis robusta]|eukprot:Sro1265_g257510.1 3-beta-glucanosyltransferase (546) ;mRNA; f:29740-31562
MEQHVCTTGSRRRSWHGFAGILLLVQWVSRASALNPVEIKGYKFFDSGSGDEFVVRGIAYDPRPNSGALNRNSVDYFTEEHRNIWERDIPYLKSLGVNAVRIYAVDSSKNHDAFMCALNQAGIYALVSLASDCPTCAITRDEAPACYPTSLKRQGQAIINAFAKYDNVLGFSAGNEVNHFTPNNNPEWNGPCQKKFLRDMRKYIASCPNIRKVPVGLVSADSERADVANYYNCAENPKDPYENAEWFGLNVYPHCDGSIKDAEKGNGFDKLIEDFQSYHYSIPAMLTEFGCISKSFPNVSGTDGLIYKGQRTFDQARWLLEEKELRDQFAGGFAFEYSIEMQNAIGDSPYPFAQWGAQNYGIGYLSPEDCDDVDIPCQYNPEPSFGYLQAAYRNSTVLDPTNIRNFSIPETRQGRTTCPSQFPAISSFKWRADRVRNLKCPASGSSSSFQCPANLNDLRVHQTDRGQNGWVVFLESILFLTVSFVVYSWLMSFVDKMSEYQEERERDEPRWIKVVMPSVSTKDTDGDSFLRRECRAAVDEGLELL